MKHRRIRNPESIDNSSHIHKLVLLLASDDPARRNEAALELRKLGANEAVEPLFRAIAVPANWNYRGTLVYALMALDCSRHFADLFDMALEGNYEVQCHSVRILEEQAMSVTASILSVAATKLAAFSPSERMSEDDTERLHDALLAILTKLRKGLNNP